MYVCALLTGSLEGEDLGQGLAPLVGSHTLVVALVKEHSVIDGDLAVPPFVDTDVVQVQHLPIQVPCIAEK